jgi:hypothetical protein
MSESDIKSQNIFIFITCGYGYNQRLLTCRKGRLLFKELKEAKCQICLSVPVLTGIHTGKGGGGEPEKRLEGQQLRKLGRKYQHYYVQ